MSHFAHVFVVAALLLVAASAHAQVSDQLTCYQIKDPAKLAGVVNLNSPPFGPAAGCKISKAKLFCVPATKTVVSAIDKGVKPPTNITPLPISGPDPGARVCYQMTCPKPLPPDTEISDQFGNRVVTKLKPAMLCVPAITGPPPPTPTPTLMPTPTLGSGTPDPTPTATPASCGGPGQVCCPSGPACNEAGCCSGGICFPDGQTCAETACVDTSACTFESSAACDETGVKTQRCTPQICSSGSCAQGTDVMQTVDCFRTTDGAACGVTAAGCPLGMVRDICCTTSAGFSDNSCSVICGTCQ
jgi:hypothetical protein